MKTPHRTPHDQIKEALEHGLKYSPCRDWSGIYQALALLETHAVVPRELTDGAEAIMQKCEIEPCLTMAEAWRQMIAAAVRGGR